MDTKFNFKSAVCTSRSQSERLLALGLKKETADMGIYYSELYGVDRVFSNDVFDGKTTFDSDEIPAWSLHRLIELIKTSEFKVLNSYTYGEVAKTFILRCIIHSDDIYEGIVEAMEILIEKYHFLNKEYLEE